MDRKDANITMLPMPIGHLNLSVRTENALSQMGIITIGALTCCTAEALLTQPGGKPRRNFGQKCLKDVREGLFREKLCLMGDEKLIHPCMGCGKEPGITRLPLIYGLCPVCTEKLLKSPWVSELLLVGLDKALEDGLFRS